MTRLGRLRSGAQAVLAPARALPGTLVVVPVVALLLGSHWTLEERHEPGTALLATASSPGAPRAVTTYLVPEASQYEPGILMSPGDSLTFEIPELRGPFTVEVQAFSRDALELSAAGEAGEFTPIWQVPALGHRGLRTRRQELEAPETPLTRLRLTPAAKHPDHRVAGLRVTHAAAVFAHAWLVPIVWGAALALTAMTLWRRTRTAAERLLAGWRRADVWVATALIVPILLRVTREVVIVAGVVALAALATSLFAHHFRRTPLVTGAYVLFLYGLFFLFLPWAVTRVLTARAAELYDLTVDHRMRPDGLEINADGVRFRGDSSDLAEGDFVVLHLGDSFTYGLNLEYEQTYPYVFERLLRAAECAAPVRAVNFGWTSSSPLLALRLLRQVGKDYHPDLVLYNLDMTDFGDDLRYERELREAGDLEVDHRDVARLLLEALTPRLPVLASLPEGLAELRRRPEQAAGDGPAVPDDRFFATAASLEETREHIERGVMKNLDALHRYARESLDARMAVVIYPRAYQYSRRESPRNWEDRRYRRLGRYVLEPFRYFDEVAGELPYPVFSLLDDFRSTDRFPLFFEDDPHWNPAGARLVAEAVAARLVEAGLVPCSRPSDGDAPEPAGNEQVKRAA